jgi:hypothetical protein
MVGPRRWKLNMALRGAAEKERRKIVRRRLSRLKDQEEETINQLLRRREHLGVATIWSSDLSHNKLTFAVSGRPGLRRVNAFLRPHHYLKSDLLGSYAFVPSSLSSGKTSLSLVDLRHPRHEDHTIDGTSLDEQDISIISMSSSMLYSGSKSEFTRAIFKAFTLSGIRHVA